MGSRSRLLKFDPGVYTTVPFVYDHWEEVYLMSGDLIVGDDAQGKVAKGSPRRPMRAARPASIMVPPSPNRAACCSKCITTTKAPLLPRPACGERVGVGASP